MAANCTVTFINIYAEHDFIKEARTLPYSLDDVLLLIAHHIKSGLYLVHGISASPNAVTVVCALLLPEGEDPLPRLFGEPTDTLLQDRTVSNPDDPEIDKRLALDSTFVDMKSNLLFRYSNNAATLDQALIGVAWQILDGKYEVHSIIGSLAYFTIVVKGKMDIKAGKLDLFLSPEGPSNIPEDWYLPRPPFGEW